MRFDPHLHTEYSNLRLLDSINKPKKLIDRAIELGLSGIAITDHEALCSHIVVDKYKKEIQKEHPDFKVAFGNEIYLIETRETKQKYYHFILIAKDKIGYKMLRMLSSVSWLNSYSDRGMERVPTLKSELKNIIDLFGRGHLIATSACLGGELSTLTLNLCKSIEVEEIYKYQSQINDYITFCKDCFGEDFYIEIAPACSQEQILVNQRLKAISKFYNIKMVIGSDAHFLRKEDRYVHSAYLNSQDGEREVDLFYEYAYLQSDEEIFNHLKQSEYSKQEVEQCFKNSLEIYDKITAYSLNHKQQIPLVEVKDYPIGNQYYKENKWETLTYLLNSQNKHERYWVNQCLEALIQKKLFNEVYLDRLEEEARVKKIIGEKLETNMYCYPITLQHYINLIWECGSTIGAGRGSSCSGLNHYLLGVTQLDPIIWQFPFFRYLNEERVELGDIDIDICPSKRPLILDKIKEERAKHFNPGIDALSREHLGCTLIATFGTETTKSTILSACRGYRSEDFPDGIDVDTAQYISSLIEQERGFLFTLEDTVYGNPDKGRKPNQLFIKEVNNYPGLLDIMFGISGLINKRSSHASGVILFDEDPYEFGCFMRSPSGDITTQWDLHDCEYAGMTKFDFLVTEIQDKIVQTLGQLQRKEVVPSNLSLKQLYDKYLHPEVMNIEKQEVWKEIGDCHILDLFQFDSPMGQQAARKIRPDNMFELACANGLIRLVAMEPGAEAPMDKYVRFKKDINEWYTEMDYYGLTKDEQAVLEKYMLEYKGMCFSQEQLMLIVMDPDICGFSLGEANNVRKVVGKKILSKIPEVKNDIFTRATSPNLAKYVWEMCVGPQMSYSFSIIHSVAYSFIGYQSALLATDFDSIYWNTACLIVNSGAVDPDKKASTDYGKIAKAIGDIRASGIKVSLADINKSEFGFIPDVENNEILFGLKGLQNVGDDVVKIIIENRPYSSFEDFIQKVNPNKQVVLSLIKGGAFDKFEDRRRLMVKYIYRTSDLKKRLTLQNFNGLVQNNLIPQELSFEKSVYYFTKYLKSACKYSADKYKLDANAQRFYFEHFDNVIVENGEYFISIKDWDKTYKKIMDRVRDWLSANQESVLKELNEKLFFDNWNKYCGNANISAWEMEALCFYYHEHELAHINLEKYGISNFKDLPNEPEVDYYFHRKNANIPIYKIDKIVGTCIAKNKNKSNISLLTKDGVVTVKFRKEYFALFDKQISQLQENGKKKVIEKSWFKRGNMLMVQGIKRDDNFIAKKYARTPGHQLYKIISIDDNGDIVLQGERNQGDYEESED